MLIPKVSSWAEKEDKKSKSMKRKLVICGFGSTGRDSDLNLESYWPSFRDHVYQFLVNLLGGPWGGKTPQILALLKHEV